MLAVGRQSVGRRGMERTYSKGHATNCWFERHFEVRLMVASSIEAGAMGSKVR